MHLKEYSNKLFNTVYLPITSLNNNLLKKLQAFQFNDLQWMFTNFKF